MRAAAVCTRKTCHEYGVVVEQAFTAARRAKKKGKATDFRAVSSCKGGDVEPLRPAARDSALAALAVATCFHTKISRPKKRRCTESADVARPVAIIITRNKVAKQSYQSFHHHRQKCNVPRAPTHGFPRRFNILLPATLHVPRFVMSPMHKSHQEQRQKRCSFSSQ